MGRVARLGGDPRVRPAIDLGDPVGVEQLEQCVVPFGVERTQRALAACEVTGGGNDRGLAGTTLLGGHGLAVHDAPERSSRRRRQGWHGRIVGQPAGSDDQDPLPERRQKVADGGAERPGALEWAQWGGDGVDEHGQHRHCRDVAEERLQGLNGSVVDVHTCRDRHVYAVIPQRLRTRRRDVCRHVQWTRVGAVVTDPLRRQCRCRMAA